MAQLTSNDAQINTAIVIESGKGTIVFNTGDADERKINISELDLPLIVPANQGVSVEGSSIVVYQSGSTATANAAYTHFRSSDGSGASGVATWNIGEGSHIIFYGGEGLLKFTELTDGAITSETIIPLNRVQYPFRTEVLTVAGQVDTAEYELLGGSFALTS